ncbi:MAG: PAS domain-containing protein [Gemmatimonadaceae bacterium]
MRHIGVEQSTLSAGAVPAGALNAAPTSPQLESIPVQALARYRHTVLLRTSELLSDSAAPVPPSDRADAFPAATRLLMSSLEELKVAEEELREQNATLVAMRAAEDRRLFYYRRLFLDSPAPAFITDLNGTIIETNLEMAALLRREAPLLEGKPLVALIMPDDRAKFRKQLARLVTLGSLREMGLTLGRMGDLPINVTASVKIVPGLGPTRSGVLYWQLARLTSDP